MAKLRNGYSLNPRALWAGEVPDGWEFFKGKYVFGERFEKGNEKNLELLSPTQKYGVIPQSMYDELSGMRAVKVKESTDLSLFKTVHIGDFCISLRSFQGGFEYSKYEGVVSPAYHILFPKKNIVDGYYKYLFKEQSFIAEMNSYCQSLRDGKNISYEDFGKTLIPYPPLTEQQAIADYLDDRCSKIDEIIAEVTASIEEYKELKQAVIFEAVTKGLDKNVPMKDSGVEWIGSIPTTWNMTILRRFCSFQTGKTPSTSVPEWFDGDVNWFTPGDFSERYYLEDSRRKLSQKALNDSAAITVNENCVMIVGIGGSAGKVGLTKIPCSCNQQVTAVMSSFMDPKYLMYYLELDGKYLKETAMFTTLPILNNDTLGNSPLIVPTIKEQKNIADYLDSRLISINALIGEKQVLVDDLQTYKKSLIYEVVTGKKRVVV